MTNQSDTSLLLLHALPLNGEMWHNQMSLLPNQTHAPNLYQHGDNIEDWAKHALTLTNSKNLIVVGCSVGGSCALEVAKQAPDRIAALFLIGTNANHNRDPQSYKKYVEYVENNSVKAAWNHYWLPHISPDNNQQATQTAEKIALSQSTKHLTNGLKAYHRRPNLINTLEQANFPIHIVTGEHDTLPGLNYSQNLAKTAKHGSLHIISNCGHYCPMTNPQELNLLLKKIIKSHG